MRSLSKYAISLVLLITITLMPAMASGSQNETSTQTTTTTVVKDRTYWEQVKQRQQNERIYWAEVVKQQKARAEAARIARLYAFAYAVEQARIARIAAQTGGSYVQGIQVCNGRDLPPCYVVNRESRFNPNAANRSSSARGLYQFLTGTWRHFCGSCGYPTAIAPVSVQVAVARRAWAGGAGCSHWMACGRR